MVSFRDLGLSSYEERVYRALLTERTATAEELSAESDVPMGRIYDVLNGLESRDLVHCNPESHPRVYSPIDAEMAIDRLLRDRKRDLEAERTRYENVAAELRSQLGSQPPTDGRFWETRSHDSEIEFVTAQIERFSDATDEVLIVGDSVIVHQFLAVLEPLERWLESVANGSIRVRILLSEQVSNGGDQLLQSLRATGQSVETRLHPSVTANFDLIDGRDLYLYVTDPFARSRPLGTIHVTEDVLVDELTDEFTAYWQEAEPLPERP
ncbi:TrmB family transcriptional regulator [Natronococcus occultus]|uniref:Putative transcriptional regulator n=1 Tax=Natronococcus occultus SP4 TaxID=694430 RepID=L0K0N4_9EURY|nr:helix-turn-helix domain-containing protein [Natronococcus occultus]AGB38837.1 putative transcriptional regulator [Natronococcus occultus SP4]